MYIYSFWNILGWHGIFYKCMPITMPEVPDIYAYFMLFLLLLLHDVKSNYYIPHPGQMPNALTVWMPYLYAWRPASPYMKKTCASSYILINFMLLLLLLLYDSQNKQHMVNLLFWLIESRTLVPQIYCLT